LVTGHRCTKWLGVVEFEVVDRLVSSRFARFRVLDQPIFLRMTPKRRTWQILNLGASGDLRDIIDALRRVSADLRHDSAFTQAELEGYARWRKKQKSVLNVVQEGSIKTAKQLRWLKGRAALLLRLGGLAAVGAWASRAAESAVRRESLAQRADAMVAQVEQFVGWRRRAMFSALRGRRLKVAADVWGRRTA
jgi:hypothetical protein